TRNPLRGQETEVHEQLKKIYLNSLIFGEKEAYIKIKGRKFRVDVLDRQNNIAYEIQRHNFGKGFYDKIKILVSQLNIIIVHPIVIRQKVTRMKNGNIIGVSYINKSKYTDYYSLFEKLVSFRTVFVPQKIGFDVLLIKEHVKKEFAGIWSNSRRPRYRMTQRELMSIEESTEIRQKSDLYSFLPKGLPEVFTNRNISERLEIPGGNKRKRRIAGCITYSLSNLGLIELVGKKGRANQFIISK
ncbi:MAG: hypothetical protein ACFFAU_11390, partial [Candidatus Hodarchaeota archaeon]